MVFNDVCATNSIPGETGLGMLGPVMDQAATYESVNNNVAFQPPPGVPGARTPVIANGAISAALLLQHQQTSAPATLAKLP